MDVCCYPWLIAQGQKGAPVIQADRSPCSSPASTLGEHFRFLPYKRNRPLLPPKVWPERLTASSFLGQEWIFHPTCGSNRPTHDILPPPHQGPSPGLEGPFGPFPRVSSTTPWTQTLLPWETHAPRAGAAAGAGRGGGGWRKDRSGGALFCELGDMRLANRCILPKISWHQPSRTWSDGMRPGTPPLSAPQGPCERD